MGLVITTLTVAIALARDGLIRRMRRALPYLNRVAGALLVLAGLYVAYYGYWEIRILAGHDVAEGPVAWVSDWSARATQRVDDLGVIAVAIALVVLLGASVLLRRRNASAPSLLTPDAPTANPTGTHDTASTSGAAR